jgi:hypothetical protein
MSLSISDFGKYELEQMNSSPSSATAQDHHYRLQRKQRLEVL